jgi:hypothetical protein
VSEGWCRPAELKEPDFDAARRRDDFQRRLKEVEKHTVDSGSGPGYRSGRQ